MQVSPGVLVKEEEPFGPVACEADLMEEQRDPMRVEEDLTEEVMLKDPCETVEVLGKMIQEPVAVVLLPQSEPGLHSLTWLA